MIKEFIKWWYTDSTGMAYMNFSECSNGDAVLIFATGIMSAAVLLVYSLIARESHAKSKQFPNSPSKKYLTDMIRVFLICGVTGYGYTIMSIWSNPYKLRVLLLTILFVYAVKLYRSMKLSSSIERILQAEIQVSNEIVRLTSLELSLKKRFKDNGGGKAKMIRYSELELLKKGKVVDDNEGIKYYLSEVEGDEISFITDMEDGARFGDHFHDCGETCYVLEGTLIAPRSGQKVLKGDSIHFPANEIHAPYAEGETKILVVFKRPQKKV